MAHRLSIALKSIAFVLGCAFAVVAAFGFYVWFAFDTGRVEAEFVRMLGEHSQRTLRIDGGLHLALWPRPALRLHAASISTAGGKAEFARLGDTRMVLALRPLLLHRIVIEEIEMDGGQLTLNRTRDGDWNIADLLHAWGDDPAATALFRLARTAVSHASLRVRDEASGLDAILGDLQFASGPLQAGQRGPLSLQAQLKASNPNLDGNLQLGANLSLDAQGGGYLDALSASLAGRTGDMRSGTTWLNVARLDWDAAGKGWHAGQLALSLRGSLQQRTLDANVKLPQLAWSDGAARAPSLDASAELGPAGADARDRSAATQRLQLTIADIAPDPQGFAARSLKLDWQRRAGSEAQAPVEASLSLTGPLRYTRQESTLSVDSLNGEARFTSPRLTAVGQHIALSGSADWRLTDDDKKGPPLTLALDANFGPDNAHLDARLSQLLPLAGECELSSKHLDLDALLAPPPQNANAIPLPLDFLREAKLDGQLRIDTLKLGGLMLTKLEGPLTLSGGRLSADDHRFALYGGNASGNFAFDAATQQLDWKLKLQKLDTAALAQDIGISLPVSGRADGSLAVSAHGGDSQALTASLQRAWQLRYTLPVLSGTDFAQSLRALRPAWHDGKPATHRNASDEKTELASLDIVAHQQGRQLAIDSLDGRASWLTLAGKGQLDLASGALTLDLQATPTHPEARSFARDLADLRGVAVPLQLQRRDGHSSVMLAAAPAHSEATPKP